MKLWSLAGSRQRIDGGVLFGDLPRALWSRWMVPDEHNRVATPGRVLLADGLSGARVLFGTGIGAFLKPALRERHGVEEPAHMLLRSLRAIGLRHLDIDAIILSHLHIGHAGGLLFPWRPEAQPALLFPNARYLVSNSAWRRANEPHLRDRTHFLPELVSLLDDSGRLELVRGEYSRALGESVRFHHSEGYTPGMMLPEIVGPRGRDGMVACADLIPGRAWLHAPVTGGLARSAEQLVDEKRAFLIDAHARRLRLHFACDPDVASVRLARDEDQRFVPRDPLTSLNGCALEE
jgi:glyoxylase-like metal-dependent hydrolase (beta-lactamase superfamily II)